MTDLNQPEKGDTRNILSIARGSGFLAAGDLFNYASRTISALVLAKALGATEYGLYNLAVSSAFVFSGIADFGLQAAMERFIAVFSKRKDHAGVRGAIQTGIFVTSVGAIGMALVMMLLAPTLAERLFDEPELTVLLRVFAVIVPILALSNILAAVARGYKRMDHSAFAYDFIQPLIRVVLILAFALLGLNALVASIILGVSYSAAVIALIYLTRNEIADRTDRVEPRRDVKDLSVFAFPFWLSSLMTKVRRNLQALLLGAFNTAASVGIFSLVSSANLIGRISNLAISTSMRPVIAELFDSGDSEEMSRLYKTTTRWTLTLNLPIFIVLIAYPEPILALFGESFISGAAALTILAAAEFVNAITGTCGSIVDMSGRGILKVVNKAVLIGLLVGGNVLLIPPYGVIGAAFAVLIGTVVINVMRVSEVRWFAGIQPWDWRTLRPLSAGIVAFGASRVTDIWVPSAGGFGALVTNLLIVTIVYVATLLLLGLPDDDRAVLQTTLNRARSAVSRNTGK